MAEPRFSVRSWLLLITMGAVVCALSVGMGFAPVIRIGLSIGYVFGILVQLRDTGPRTEGVISCACAAIFNLIPFLPIGFGHHEPSFVEQFAAEAAGVVLFGIWLTFAILAIRTRRGPNRAIGALSLLSVISPGILGYLDHCQYLVLSFLGFEWWHIRPFDCLAQLLWFS